jgi:hypothetical protein
MKKFSTSLAIKELQIKTTLRFHLTPVIMVFFKNTSKNVERQYQGNIKWLSCPYKSVHT